MNRNQKNGHIMSITINLTSMKLRSYSKGKQIIYTSYDKIHFSVPAEMRFHSAFQELVVYFKIKK